MGGANLWRFGLQVVCGELEVEDVFAGQLRKPVAVKFLPALGQAEQQKQFSAELEAHRAAMRAAGDGVAELIGSCVKGGQYCVVMRRYERSLADELKADGPLSSARQLEVGATLAGVLAKLHSRKVVVKDLKPDNVLLDAGRPVIADFGISVVATKTLAAQTSIKGTFAYMSPEQFGELVGPPADVWSLACVILEIGTGVAPWAGLTMQAIMGKVVVHKKAPPVPDGCPCAAVLRRCFTFDPAGRPTAAQLQDELLLLLAKTTGGGAGPSELHECAICMDELPLAAGVLCAAGGAGPRHFVCKANGCFDGLVKSASQLDMMNQFQQRGGVCCPGEGCLKPYTDRAVAQHVSDDAAYDGYRQAQDRLTEMRVVQEAEVERVRKAEAEKARRAALSAAQREVDDARLELEPLLYLACPRCSQVFVDWSGCTSLSCCGVGCACVFCAWCLKDCGKDAHSHVAVCPMKPAGASKYGGEQEQVMAVQRVRQAKGIAGAFAALSPRLRAPVAKALAPAMVHSGLGEEPGLPAECLEQCRIVAAAA